MCFYHFMTSGRRLTDSEKKDRIKYFLEFPDNRYDSEKQDIIHILLEDYPKVDEAYKSLPFKFRFPIPGNNREEIDVPKVLRMFRKKYPELYYDLYGVPSEGSKMRGVGRARYPAS